MALILSDNYDYSKLRILNKIAQLKQSTEITQDDFIDYIKLDNTQNFLIKDKIKLITTDYKVGYQIYEIPRGIDAFIGFISDIPIKKCDILQPIYNNLNNYDDNYDYNYENNIIGYNTKKEIITDLIKENIIIESELSKILINIQNNTIKYKTEKIYKIGLISRNQYVPLHIKIYYDISAYNKNKKILKKNNIYQCGYFCMNNNIRFFFYE